MDSIFGIGAPELIVILILAGIVMGPKRVSQVARWLGRTTRQLQNISRGFLAQLNAEIDAVDETGDVKAAMQEVQELRQQISDLRKEISTSANQSVQEGQNALQESADRLKQASQIPTLDSSEGNNGSENKIGHNPTTLPKPIEVPDDPE